MANRRNGHLRCETLISAGGCSAGPMTMNDDETQRMNDEKLRAILLEARPAAPPLPFRFQESVWRRIEKEEAAPIPPPSLLVLLERWADRLFLPRFALASLALLLVAGGLTGFVSSADSVKQQAQERYLSSVAPNILH